MVDFPNLKAFYNKQFNIKIFFSNYAKQFINMYLTSTTHLTQHYKYYFPLTISLKLFNPTHPII